MSLIDDIRKALQSKSKNEFIDQILKEQAFYDALHKAGLDVVPSDPQERGILKPYGVLSKVQKIDRIDLIDLITRINEITTIKTIQVISSLPDITVKGSEGGAFKQTPIATGQWVSPDGFSDPNSQWTDEALAYDANDATFCYTLVPAYPTWTSFVYFTLSTPISSNKLAFELKKINVDQCVHLIDIDAHINGSWVDVFEDYKSDFPQQFYDVEFGTGIVDQIRIRVQSTYAEKYFGLAEIKLWKLGTVGGEMIVVLYAWTGSVWQKVRCDADGYLLTKAG
jgi:hypothetical protein